MMLSDVVMVHRYNVTRWTRDIDDDDDKAPIFSAPTTRMTHSIPLLLVFTGCPTS